MGYQHGEQRYLYRPHLPLQQEHAGQQHAGLLRQPGVSQTLFDLEENFDLYLCQVTEAAPLAVTLAEFSAVQQGDAVLVTWETASELGNLGFNLYRGTSPDGWDRQLNPALIPSQAPGSPSGFTYTWTDQADLAPGATYYYWLEAVDVNGTPSVHGPVSVDYVGPPPRR
ncbi:MAG: hypothetical protein HZY76_13210 [Anaerolineae bacterium]|nr:MAG: hypothetical protein HZY76_13210 [Anaerolineae bacterium]